MIKIFYIVFLSVIIIAAKNFPLDGPKKERYVVIASHTPEQCRRVMEEMKTNELQLSRFDFGCNYNDHTFYGVVEGTSEGEVRSSLPTSLQFNAKIKKVDKLSAAEIEKLHITEKTYSKE